MLAVVLTLIIKVSITRIWPQNINTFQFRKPVVIRYARLHFKECMTKTLI